jgi:hypothetical protein
MGTSRKRLKSPAMTESVLRRRAGVWLALVFLLGSAVAAGSVQVPIGLPLAARMDVSGIQTILITHYVEGDHPHLALSQEMVDLLRRTLERETHFKIIAVEPPNLPEQTIEDLLNNAEFWRTIAKRYGADLVLSGEVLFDIENRSGFVAEDYISPVTGQRVRRTRYAEQEAFDFSLQVFFFSGETGELTYRDRFSEEALIEGDGVDHLHMLNAMMNRLEPDILGILKPRERQETRYLFTD